MRHCNRCGKDYKEYPAISRRDTITEICSDCGNEESYVDYYGIKKMPKDQQERELTFRKKLGVKK